MDFCRVGKETKSNTVHRCITPALIEEASSTVQVVEVRLILWRTPEAHVCDLEIAPEMACRVAVSLAIVIRSSLLICQPLESIWLGLLVLVLGQELDCLRPETRDRFWAVVQVDGESISLVIIAHEAEDIIVDIAEEVNVWLHTPVVLHVEQCRVLVEQPTVPATHLVVALQARILHVLFLQQLCALLHHVPVDPARNFPVLLWDNLVFNLGLGVLPGLRLKLFGERHVIYEGPRVVELMVPCSLKVFHGLYQLAKL